MRQIQAKATIAEDRRLILQLPDDVVPGEHQVVVMIDEPGQGPSEPEVTGTVPVRREGHVLVYNGTIEGFVEGWLDQVREERTQRLIDEAQP